MKIALTGGIACGKSTLAKFLEELGIRVLDADDVVHELESPGGEAVEPIRRRFGDEVLAKDGGVDRARLAALVFAPGSDRSADASSDTANTVNPRRELESILFPMVRRRLLDFVNPEGLESNPRPSDVSSDSSARNEGLRIASIPLLFESHWESDYDIILAIASPEEVQIDRMMRTRGYTRAQAEARLAAQLPAMEKVLRADFAVVNDSTPEHLKKEARRMVSWLKERAKHEHRR